jgi:hypothetical protein
LQVLLGWKDLFPLVGILYLELFLAVHPVVAYAYVDFVAHEHYEGVDVEPYHEQHDGADGAEDDVEAVEVVDPK